jgi:hypothetical protein
MGVLTLRRIDPKFDCLVGLRVRDGLASAMVVCRCGGRGGRAGSTWAAVTVCARGRSGSLGASGPLVALKAAGLGLLPGIGGGAGLGSGVSAGASAIGCERVGFRTGNLGAGALTAGGARISLSVADDDTRESCGVGNGVIEGEGEVRGIGFVARLGSGGLGDVERDGGWDWDATLGFRCAASIISVDSGTSATVDRLSIMGLSGPVIAPSVDIR